MASIDSQTLRKAFGSFMTGVTVVTTRAANGELAGFTANSFTSVSMDPLLLLVCPGKHISHDEGSVCCRKPYKKVWFICG